MKTYLQGGTRIRACVRGFSRGVQQSQVSGETDEDRRGDRRQDFLCRILQLQDQRDCASVQEHRFEEVPVGLELRTARLSSSLSGSLSRLEPGPLLCRKAPYYWNLLGLFRGLCGISFQLHLSSVSA